MNTSDEDGEILYSEATIAFKGENHLNDVWIVDSGST